MAITYGTSLIIVIIPILIIDKFWDENSGTIWLRNLPFIEEIQEENKSKVVYPSFLNVLVNSVYRLKGGPKIRKKKIPLNYTSNPLDEELFYYDKEARTPILGTIHKDEEQPLTELRIHKLFHKIEEQEWRYNYLYCAVNYFNLDEIVKMFEKNGSIYVIYFKNQILRLRIFGLKCDEDRMTIKPPYLNGPINEIGENFIEHLLPQDIDLEGYYFFQKDVVIYQKRDRQRSIGIYSFTQRKHLEDVDKDSSIPAKIIAFSEEEGDTMEGSIRGVRIEYQREKETSRFLGFSFQILVLKEKPGFYAKASNLILNATSVIQLQNKQDRKKLLSSFRLHSNPKKNIFLIHSTNKKFALFFKERVNMNTNTTIIDHGEQWEYSVRYFHMINFDLADARNLKINDEGSIRYLTDNEDQEVKLVSIDFKNDRNGYLQKKYLIGRLNLKDYIMFPFAGFELELFIGLSAKHGMCLMELLNQSEDNPLISLMKLCIDLIFLLGKGIITRALLPIFLFSLKIGFIKIRDYIREKIIYRGISEDPSLRESIESKKSQQREEGTPVEPKEGAIKEKEE